MLSLSLLSFNATQSNVKPKKAGQQNYLLTSREH
jgi:hypothetical protein